MATQKNWQKVEHELWRTHFALHELLRSKETQRWNPMSRAYIQQLADLTREAADCAHNKRDFAVQMSIYVQAELPVEPEHFDENGFPANWE